MKSFSFRLVMILISVLAVQAKAEVYTDKFTQWSPKGKLFDVMCFNSDNRLVTTLRDAEMIFMNRYKFKVNTPTGPQEFQDLKCVLEQKGALPVARIEFTEAIYRVECNLAIQTIRRADFRLLNKNKNFTSIKRLSDGKIWILPTNSCELTMVLPSLKPDVPEPLPPTQAEVKVEGAKP